MGGKRRLGAALVAFAAFGLTAGCSQMSNPTYDLEDSGCSTATDPTLQAIQERLDATGTLRNGRQVPHSGGGTFVSAELHLRSDDPHDNGEILTWITDDVEGSDFFSVDTRAREDSSWPASDVDVREPGARESRACVSPSLGKTRAQVECEEEEASGEIAADRDCEDL